MPAKKKPEGRVRAATMSVKVDPALYDRYKAKLTAENKTIVETIENHMKVFLGEELVEDEVVKASEMLKDIEDLKKAMGELKPNWQEKTNHLKAS